jgi:hypothetical protein
LLPFNIQYRTFFMRAAQYGTAFTLDIDGGEFLVTARHLLETHQERQSIQLMRAGTWHKLECSLIGVGAGELDIAVLRAPIRLTDPGFVVDAQFGGCYVGQDMFFVGYPFKMWIDYGVFTDGLPGVFLKKGCLSACDMGPPKTLYIDALNNEGFSGGPLYYFPNGDPGKTPRIAGVVSKFKIEHEPVIDGKGESTEMKVAYNTGFLVAYDIAHAIEIAKGVASN